LGENFTNLVNVKHRLLDSGLKHLNIKIIGRVQGVGFRYSALLAAHQFGIKGYIRNLADGSVYIEAEGTERQLEDFISWCKKGPPRAKIFHVSTLQGSLQSFNEFEIR
jgi:acylphosphatase